MDSRDVESHLRRAKEGDERAIADLLMSYRARLERVVSLRLDRRLQGRIDAADVVQEAYVAAFRRIHRYLANPDKQPFYLWLRLVTGQKLRELHRQHLGVQARDARREISLYRGALPQASSVVLAAQLLGRFTSPSKAAVRAETRIALQDALNSMPEIDREILALRHFEDLTNSEAALVLGLSRAAASNRYVRAVKRLRKILAPVPGTFDEAVAGSTSHATPWEFPRLSRPILRPAAASLWLRRLDPAPGGPWPERS